MPRFFFHIRDGHDIPDEEGTELPGIEFARREAVHLAGRLLIDQSNEFWSGEDWRVEVTDENKVIQFALHFMVKTASAVLAG